MYPILGDIQFPFWMYVFISWKLYDLGMQRNRAIIIALVIAVFLFALGRLLILMPEPTFCGSSCDSLPPEYW
jgi:hypothetical protein